MRTHDHKPWLHQHQFNPLKKHAETKTLLVVLLTCSVMVIEIIAGWYFGSMALFADGWHMLTHAAALSISLLAYVFARRLSGDKRFAFGTWKIEILGAYTSAIVLGFVGLFVLYTSIERLIFPESIAYNQAIVVAVIGLLVNMASAVILQVPHSHGTIDHPHGHALEHEHEHEHTHDHPHPHAHDTDMHHTHADESTDLNLKSAYLHVLADALTSVLAIIALLGAKYLNLNFLDPSMGIIGALLIFRWTWLLLKRTTAILLDRNIPETLPEEIIQTVEEDRDSIVTDIHLLQVAQNTYACELTILTHTGTTAAEYKERLRCHAVLQHLTIEVHEIPAPTLV